MGVRKVFYPSPKGKKCPSSDIKSASNMTYFGQNATGNKDKNVESNNISAN